ncbi:hypothetical protein D3C80_1059890 [compost metagenome]
MAVVHRDLSDRAREGHRQFARWVVIAKQHISNCVTAFGTRKPGFQQRVSLLIFFDQRQRTTVHQHQDQRFAGGFQRSNQVALTLWKGDIRTAGRLVRHALRFTDDCNHHVRLFRRVDGFVDHRLCRTRINFHRLFVLVQERHNVFIVGDVRAFGINHFAVFTQRVFNPRQHGNGLIGHARSGPAPHHVTFAVSQRTNDRNGAGFFQRQRVETVFQQYQTFARHFTRVFAVQTTFRVGIRRIGIFRSQMAVRIVKQPHVVFYIQHMTRGIIQLSHRDLAGFHQIGQIFAVILVAHAHVDTGFERHAHRVFWVGRRTVLNQLFNRAVIGNGDAFKAPLIAQNIFEQPGI